jgi:hypothetical protein
MKSSLLQQAAVALFSLSSIFMLIFNRQVRMHRSRSDHFAAPEPPALQQAVQYHYAPR